jgi:prefoldin subunit 5
MTELFIQKNSKKIHDMQKNIKEMQENIKEIRETQEHIRKTVREKQETPKKGNPKEESNFSYLWLMNSSEYY